MCNETNLWISSKVLYGLINGLMAELHFHLVANFKFYAKRIQKMIWISFVVLYVSTL